MSSDGSVTHWLRDLQAGDPAAAQPLWDRYFGQLVELARKRLQGLPRAAADEEDVALSAFASFCRAAEAGRFPDLRDRDNLWHLLVTITGRKAAALRQHEQRLKRGGPIGAAELPSPDMLPDSEPTPEFAAILIEEYQQRLASLPEEELRSVAMWKMEGWTNEEIAQKLGYQVRTVERKLQLIRRVWSKESAA